MNDMVFVGGIHGVGKTLFCNTLSTRYNIPCYSAGELIAQEIGIIPRVDKRVEDINRNQETLLSALMKLDRNNELILLSGHFCVINKEGTVNQISESTFRELLPRGIIVLVDGMEDISERLYARDGVRFNTDFLETFQRQELTYSKQISNTLNVPYLVHNEGDTLEKVDKFMGQILSQ